MNKNKKSDILIKLISSCCCLFNQLRMYFHEKCMHKIAFIISPLCIKISQTFCLIKKYIFLFTMHFHLGLIYFNTRLFFCFFLSKRGK